MKFFADLHLCPILKKPHQTKEMIEKSAELGYNAVGISFPLGVREKEIHEMREVCSASGMSLVTRIDLTPKSSRDLLKSLRNLRRKIEIIAVRLYTKNVARQAAKDRRVDLISFPSTNPRKHFFDSAEAELASKASASLEVDMAPLLYLQGLRRSRLIFSLRKELLMAKKFRVPIVLSSGANEVSLLRKPEDYAFLSYLFGMDFDRAMQSFSETPLTIIERNRRKLNSNYIAPGVYIIKRGKDCSHLLGDEWSIGT
jgi:ribonuclease P/MRP protein subunit RPP1